MTNHGLTTRTLLEIFHQVCTHGQKHQGAWEWKSVRAWNDFDGYTCWLSYKDLTATLLFHGNLSIEYDNLDTLTEFTAKCQIMATYVQCRQS